MARHRIMHAIQISCFCNLHSVDRYGGSVEIGKRIVSAIRTLTGAIMPNCKRSQTMRTPTKRAYAEIDAED